MVMNADTKLICVGIGLLMCVQNYMFFLGFWDSYSKISLSEDCAGVRWWLGYDTVVCWIESFFVLGMMLGAVWDGSKVLWWVFFILHLIDAVPGYTFATIFLYKNVNSDAGLACAAADPIVGDAFRAVSYTQAYFGYVFYIFFMLSLMYIVLIKKDDEEGPFLEEKYQNKIVIGVVGVMMMVQNFGFGVTYWDLFQQIGHEEECLGSRWWLGYDGIVCVIETVFAGCLILGGWIDSSKVFFWVFWVLHAIDAVPGYTGACIYLGQNLKSADGLKCAKRYPSAHKRSLEVWDVQLAFYVFYIFCMLTITYFSAIKKPKDYAGVLISPRDAGAKA